MSQFVSMILSSGEYFKVGLVLFLLYFIIYQIVLYQKKRRMSLFGGGVMILFSVYMVGLFAITISPIYGFHLKPDFATVNYSPFEVIHTIGSNPANFYGNMIMFLPFGCFLPMISKRYEKGTLTILSGALVSMLIEFIQLFLARGTDIDDIILNTIGTIGGYCIYRFVIIMKPTILNFTGIIQNRTGKKVKRDGSPVLIIIMLMVCSTLFTGFTQRAKVVRPYVRQESKRVVITPIPTRKANVTSTVRVQNVANAVYVLNVRNNESYYAKNEAKEVAPASTTKLLTALTVAVYCNPNETVKVGDEIGLVAKDASRAGLRKNNVATVKQLLEGLLLPSGNDAAYTLAAFAGRKILGRDADTQEAVEAFVVQMNEQAKKVGATHSNFMSPDGYDKNGQYSTAEDLCLIAKAFLYSDYSNGLLKEIAHLSQVREVFPDGTDVTWNNTNQLLNKRSKHYNPSVIGLKTGSSKEAGMCVISAAYIKKELYICAVMGDSREGRFTDSNQIYHQLKDNKNVR